MTLVEIVRLAVQVFGSEEKAARWLTRPRIQFGDLPPLLVAATPEGAERVTEALHQIDGGMFV